MKKACTNKYSILVFKHEEVIIPVDEETDSKSSAVDVDAMEFLARLVARHNGEMNLDDIANELKKNPQIELQTNKLLTFLQEHSNVFSLNGTSVGLVAERDDSIYSSLESAPSNRYFSRRPTVGAGRIIRRRDRFESVHKIFYLTGSLVMRNTNVFCDAKAVLSKEVHSTSAIISDSCEIFGQTARLKVSGFSRF
jgi:hypothetical protein